MSLMGIFFNSILLLLFGFTLLLIIPSADARTNYDVGITLSKTCLAMIKNNITSTCPTYDEILILFPDTTNQNISGKFVYKDGYLQREHTKFVEHWGFYTYQPVTLWIDPPGDIVGRIATITIEPSLPDYLVQESQKLINNTMIVGHSRWVDSQCYRSTITAADWIFLTGDTINLMFHNCDPAFTNFYHLKSKFFGASYQDVATSNKYKLDQVIKLAKEKYRQSYIGSNEIVYNSSVTTDENER